MISFVPLLARCMLAAIFVISGYNKLMNIGGTAGYIASKGLPMAQVLAAATTALELVGGIALVIGFYARWAALALALFCVAAAVLFHGTAAEQIQFMKNIALAGGMLMVFAFGPGTLAVTRR